MDTARERRHARVADVAGRVEVRPRTRILAQRIAQVVDRGRASPARFVTLPIKGRVEAFDLDIADRAEARPALASAARRLVQRAFAPRLVSVTPVISHRQSTLALGPGTAGGWRVRAPEEGDQMV